MELSGKEQPVVTSRKPFVAPQMLSVQASSSSLRNKKVNKDWLLERFGDRGKYELRDTSLPVIGDLPFAVPCNVFASYRRVGANVFGARIPVVTTFGSIEFEIDTSCKDKKEQICECKSTDINDATIGTVA